MASDVLSQLMNQNTPRAGWVRPTIPCTYIMAITKTGQEYDAAEQTLRCAGWSYHIDIDAWVYRRG